MASVRRKEGRQRRKTPTAVHSNAAARWPAQGGNIVSFQWGDGALLVSWPEGPHGICKDVEI